MEDDTELLKSLIKSKRNRDNWYVDELLERVSHIQEHANNKDITVIEYLQMLDGIARLISKIKEKIEADEFVDFNADDYTFNEFYKLGNEKRFSKTAIIRKYLSTMNKQDIHTLCSKFGKDRVIKELNYKYKELFEIGFFDVKGMKIPLTGDYKEHGTFKEILEMVNSYE